MTGVYRPFFQGNGQANQAAEKNDTPEKMM
jgi:hypothetical protein